ncbi:MAG: UV DNA damage repair endonuclease UvsE [Armatimonadota bacterium]|nr:UV DNA damage repair endonuclease UvsE [bacterium]MDW8321518.1 UV DNA damage repair endonuclease UvsE [Armatimonadota bacterium]
MIRWGYPCENITLDASTNHTLQLRNIREERIREKFEQNLRDLWRMLEWNVLQGIALFRIGQHLVPFASHPHFPYDWYMAHADALREVGRFARQHGLRLSMHPGQYVNVGSPHAGVVERSLAELRYSATVLDALGLPDSVLVIHLGGVYEGHHATAQRIVKHLQGEEQILRWLVLEHDERLWSLRQVLPVAEQLDVPVIVDNLHHRLNPDHLTLQEAVRLGLSTWNGKRPKLHLSSQDESKRAGAHAGRIDLEDLYELLDALEDAEADIMVEAKEKELAVLPLLSATGRKSTEGKRA